MTKESSLRERCLPTSLAPDAMTSTRGGYRASRCPSKAGMRLARVGGMLDKRLVLTMIVLAAGCRQNPEESAVSQPAPPPAAALARQNLPLDQSLKELEKELSTAIGRGMDDAAEANILRAEAITDGLLESEMPFSWLTANAYSLDSYLRQIQALADRVVAQMRSGVEQTVITREVIDLRRKVISVRRALAMGGTSSPPSLDSLLAGHPADSIITADEAGE